MEHTINLFKWATLRRHVAYVAMRLIASKSEISVSEHANVNLKRSIKKAAGSLQEQKIQSNVSRGIAQ